MKKKIDSKSVNEILLLTKSILKVLLILVIILISWVSLMIIDRLHIWNILMTIIGILAPLFIGLLIAWLLDPFVNYLRKHKIKRFLGVFISYVLMIGTLSLIIGSILPILYEQIVELVESIPSTFATLEEWVNNIFHSIDKIDGIDAESIKESIFATIETYGKNLYENLPAYIFGIGGSILSGAGTIVVGMVIGFFLLLSFEDVGDTILEMFPEHMQKDAKKIGDAINGSLRKYVLGVVIDAFLIFIICSIAFCLVGLRAPLLFALFCAITNVIPYVGPYLGAVPALIVGFSMSPNVGLLTLIAIAVIQFFEGNFIQDVIMAKTTKLHPVVIIVGLLVFNHFWGIIGMAISTPVIAIFKIIVEFIIEKYEEKKAVFEEESDE